MASDAERLDADDGRPDEVLDIDDVLGRRGVETRLHGRLSVPEENAAAALEVMSRFAMDPRWLIYLPPTMAPTATSERPDLLEHPAEAFASYRREGVETVLCEEKHMGSRAVVVVCRDEAVATRRFRVDANDGAVFTRTGREFFSDRELRRAVLDAMRSAIGQTGLWEELSTDWLALDCEIVPWSLKAEELLRNQYASVGAAAIAALGAAIVELEFAAGRGIEVTETLERQRARLTMAEGFVEAYRPYCWPVSSLADVRVAPFQVLAGEGGTYFDRPHSWHMATVDRLAAADGDLIRTTGNVTVDLADEASCERAAAWWEELTGSGGEGMVVKPPVPISRGRRGLVQPGIKVRGRSTFASSTDPSTRRRPTWIVSEIEG